MNFFGGAQVTYQIDFNVQWQMGSQSSLLPATCGVPQGSVLGPLFFLVYVNDIQGVVNNCALKLYADDTVLYTSGADSIETAHRLQQGLDLFCGWCRVNKLTINIKKTKVMTFGSRQRVKKAKDVLLKIGGVELKVVPSYKYLGLILDSTLNYNMHIQSTIRIILHKLSLLAKMKKFLTNDTALSIYKAMLLPYFDYGDIIYDKANCKDLDKLQKLQNKCLRICLGQERRFSTEVAHGLTKVPFLKNRRSAHVLNFMYKRKANVRLMNVREIRTRAHDAPLFEVEIPRCEAFKRSVGYFGSVEWNNLTPDVRNTGSYLAFKNIQKKNMLDQLQQIQ